MHSSHLHSRFVILLQPRHCLNNAGLGSSPFARHYLGNHFLFSLPAGTKMFQFPAYAHLYGVIDLPSIGLPHSEIRGSMDICSSPWLIAAYHVLLRLQEPRHPPCALLYFLGLDTTGIATFVSRRFLRTLFLEIVLYSFLQYVKDLYFVENNGFEPLTLCVQGRCSSQLS